MVERSGRGKKKQRKKQLLGSHQRSWLWGRNLVTETLSAGAWPIVELYLAEELPDGELERTNSLAERVDLRPSVLPRAEIERLCHTGEHQGYLARMGPFPYRSVDQVLQQEPAASFYLVLDGIQDPHNFGAILRSAAVLGADAVFIGDQRQVAVTSQVARSSAGGVNRIPIAQTSNVPELLMQLRQRGLEVIGASEKTERSLTEIDLRRSAAIVIGNEGEGISPAALEACSSLARIPLTGDLGSLNAAVAAAIFCYEVQRQRSAPVGS